MVKQGNPYRRLREELDITHGEMADAIGLSRVRWTQLEGGHGGLSARPLIALERRYRRQIRKLGLTLDDFVR